VPSSTPRRSSCRRCQLINSSIQSWRAVHFTSYSMLNSHKLDTHTPPNAYYTPHPSTASLGQMPSPTPPPNVSTIFLHQMPPSTPPTFASTICLNHLPPPNVSTICLLYIPPPNVSTICLYHLPPPNPCNQSLHQHFHCLHPPIASTICLWCHTYLDLQLVGSTFMLDVK
jgi:hypothetical protein